VTLPVVHYHVAHCLWDPARVAWLKEFRQTFPHPFRVAESAEKVHASVWARKLWLGAAEEDAEDGGPDWHVFLNDDVDVCPNPDAFAAALTAAESDVVAFHTSCTNLTDLNWCKTYWMTGPAYAFRKGIASEMLLFMDSLPKGFFETPGNNEDVVGIFYAWSRQQPIWSTVPALVKHRIEIPSTLGYDHHALRQSPIPFDHPAFKGQDLGDPARWACKDPPFIENPWNPARQLDARWKVVKELAAAQLGDAPSPIMCSMCIETPMVYRSDKTNAGICKLCAFKIVAATFGIQIGQVTGTPT
jgi:hypothetical protein